MVNFDEFSSENTVIFDDFSPKMAKVRQNMSPGALIKSGVLITWIRFLIFQMNSKFDILLYHAHTRLHFLGSHFKQRKIDNCISFHQ